MLTLRVDSSLIPGVNAPITVDALLCAIDPVLGQSGRIVTALRINGVEEPAFRESAVLARDLAADDLIDVDTTPVVLMAAQALDDALRFLPDLSAGARAVAADLRGPRADEGRQALGGLADNLALFVALVHTADLWARQAGLAATDWLGEDVAAVERATGLLEDAAAAGDWAAVAATLDTHLPQSLDGWHRRLTAGRAAVEALHAAPTA
jgi:hypothetical protein